MKNKIFDLMVILSFLILLLEVLFHKALVFETISYSLHIWVTSLIPSMFPFFVISDILIQYHITNYIPTWLKKTFTKLFRVSEPVVTVFFLSCISGFPSNARNTRALYDQKLLTKEEASHALIFTHFSNPLFILSTVAVFFLHREAYGYCILVAHYLGNIVLGVISSYFYSPHDINYTHLKEKSQSFSTILIKAIRSSIDTLLLILGTLTCFLVLSSLMIHHLKMGAYSSSIMKGILEITMGLKSLSLLSVNDCYKVVISTMFISFGGLSVHLQVLSQLVDTEISYHPFFIARIFHAIISGGISYLLFCFFF